MKLLALTFEFNEKMPNSEGIFQNYIFLANLMSPKENYENSLILITPYLQPINEISSYENIVSQLMAFNTKFMIINLDDVKNKFYSNYRVSEFIKKINGISLDFTDILPEIPQQTNPINYIKNEDFTYISKQNAEIISCKLLDILSEKENFYQQLENFLENSKISVKYEKLLAKNKKIKQIINIDNYDIYGNLQILKNIRISETFRIKTENEKTVNFCINWKPDIKIIYHATQISENKLSIEIKVKLSQSIYNAFLLESEIRKNKGNCVVEKLKEFITEIQNTDYILNKIGKICENLLNSSSEISLDIKEISEFPICTYHKWFIIKSFDILYSTKMQIKINKNRNSYLTDFLLFKKLLQSVLKEFGYLEISTNSYFYSFSPEKSFSFLKIRFLNNNSATIYFCFTPNITEAIIKPHIDNVLSKINLAKKLHIFNRPLRFLLFFNKFDEILTYFSNEKLQGNQKNSSIMIKENYDDENFKFCLEEAEKELFGIFKQNSLGGSIFTYFPPEKIILNYLHKKKFIWEFPSLTVLKSFIQVLVKQRHNEGFMQILLFKENIIFIKEYNVQDCCIEKDGKILIFYAINRDLENYKIETELYMEKKDILIQNSKLYQLISFENICEEIYRIDNEISKIVYSFHSLRQACIQKCMDRKQNSLKYCGFFFDMNETNVSDLFFIKVYSTLLQCYQIYCDNKYKQNLKIDNNLPICLNDSFTNDAYLLYQNSTYLGSQHLIMLGFTNIRSHNNNDLEPENYQHIIYGLKQNIDFMLEEFADAVLTFKPTPDQGPKKIYAKLMCTKHIVLLTTGNSLDSSSTIIEYRHLSKNLLGIFETLLMSHEEKRRQSSRSQKHKENINDILIIQLLENAELDFPIFSDPEIHDVHFEMSLRKIIDNFQYFLNEEYNSLLLQFVYELLLKKYLIEQSVLEKILDNSHKFAFSFGIPPIFNTNLFTNLEMDEILNYKFSEIFSTFFTELYPGCYYFLPKPHENFNNFDKELFSELENIFNNIKISKKLPLFVKLNICYYDKQNNANILKPLYKFTDIFDKKFDSNYEISLQAIIYLIGDHKKYSNDSYYCEKRDIEDLIKTEEYYEEFTENISQFENFIFNNNNEKYDKENIIINVENNLNNGKNNEIIYPFQSNLFSQLIPENYKRGNFVFSLSDEYIYAIYSILRPIKSFISQLTLSQLAKISKIENISENMLNYIRLKLGEILNNSVVRQFHKIFFVDYSENAIQIFDSELNSLKYNIRNLSNFYYVVWHKNSPNLLNLIENNTQNDKISENYLIKYWILFNFNLQHDFMNVQVLTNFGFLENENDNPENIRESFEIAFEKISKKVNQQILLNQLDKEKECPELLFPNMKPIITNSDKKERPSIAKLRFLWIQEHTNINIERRKSIQENYDNEAISPIKSDIQGKVQSSLVPDLIFSKEFIVNERVTLKSLADYRYKFLETYSVINRPFMYVINDGKNIFVLKFLEKILPLPYNQKLQNSNHIIIMEIYGIEEISKDLLENLILTVENKFTMIALMKIAQNITLSSGYLSLYDYKFLENAENKLMLFFPIPNEISDIFAFMKYTSQNLRKFMITCKLENSNFNNFNQKYLLNELPIILNTESYGRIENFEISGNDQDLNLVFNFMHEIQRVILGQIFGDGLCLLKIQALKNTEKLNFANFVNNFTTKIIKPMKKINRNVPLLKYKKNTQCVENISVFEIYENNDIKFNEKISEENMNFMYPAIIKLPKNDNEKLEINIEEKNNNNNNSMESKYFLNLSLSIKGMLNLDDFIKTLILYINQTFCEYLFEKMFELFELDLLNILMNSTILLENKKTLFLKNINKLSENICQINQKIALLKCPTFYSENINISVEYRNHIELFCEIIKEIFNKLTINSNMENLCIFLVISYINNQSGAIEKTYILRNLQNHDYLTQFLKTNITFATVEMKNFSIRYKFIMLSKNINEINILFKNTNEGIAKNKIELIDCSINLAESAGNNSAQKLKPKNISSSASDTHISFNPEDFIEEILFSSKSQPNIQIKQNGIYHIIPRNCYIQIILNKANLEFLSYNLNKKTLDLIKKSINYATLICNKKSEALTGLLLKKLGIYLPTKSQNITSQPETNSVILSTFAVQNLSSQDWIKEIVNYALRNEQLNTINQYTPQEKSISTIVPSRPIILGELEQSDIFSRSANNEIQHNFNLFELASGNLLKHNNENTDILPEFSYNMPYSVQLLEKIQSKSLKIYKSQKSLSYLHANPLYFHTATLFTKFEQYKKQQKTVLDKLQFFTNYKPCIDAELENKFNLLMETISAENHNKKNLNGLINSVKMVSKLVHFYTIPFMFTCPNSVKTFTDSNLDNVSNIKKSYIKIFNDYFNGLCEMIKSHCNATEIFISNVNMEFINNNLCNLDSLSLVQNQKSYLGKSESQINLPKLETSEKLPELRKITSSSSLSSKKDSAYIERDEKLFSLSNPAYSKSSAYKLLSHNINSLINQQETKAYFFTLSQSGGYIIELECLKLCAEIKVYNLPDLLSIEHMANLLKIGIKENLGEMEKMQIETLMNNTISALRLDAFNYDIHINSFLHILHGSRTQKNYIEVMNSFMRYYIEPPKKARNNIKSILLTIHLGDIENDIEQFWKYFVTNSARYGYKPLQTSQLIYCGLLESETFVDSDKSRKLSRDISEEKKDSIGGIYGQNKENITDSMDLEVIQESFERSSSSKIISQQYKKPAYTIPQIAISTINFASQLKRQDSSTSNRGIFIRNLHKI